MPNSLPAISSRNLLQEKFHWNSLLKLYSKDKQQPVKEFIETKKVKIPPKRYTKSLETVSIKRGVRKVESSFFRFL
jgi:hypothetical protein